MNIRTRILCLALTSRRRDRGAVSGDRVTGDCVTGAVLGADTGHPPAHGRRGRGLVPPLLP